jgi:UDP-glucose 4-epimerase
MGRYLVTGAAGFIGSHLCEALVRRGDAVIALDDLSTGSLDNLSALSHPSDTITGSRLTFVRGCVTDERLLHELTADADSVCHLASDVGIHRTMSRPDECWRRNTEGARAVLGAASRRRLPTLLLSTSEVYGLTPAVPVSEGAPRIAPVPNSARWAYAASKVAAELEAERSFSEHRLPVVIARIFNTVGPRQSGRYGMVLPRLIDQALRGDELTVHGDGHQRRCFCDVDETVAALLDLTDDDRAVGRTLNVGTDHETSILQLADLVLSATGSSSGVRLVPYDEAYTSGYEDVRRRVPDLRALERLVGWRPSGDLGAALERAVHHARRALGPSVGWSSTVAYSASSR